MQKNAERRIHQQKFLPDATFLFAACLVIATILMFWLGVRAVQEWERSTRESIESRSKQALSLLTVALDRDMKGGQTSILLPFNQFVLEQSSLYDLADRFAGAFARFPYLESFFVWSAADGADGRAHFFNRAERLPVWEEQSDSGDLYPVAISVNPAPLDRFVDETRARAASGAAFAVVEDDVAGTRYQALAHLIYSGTPATRLRAVVGFTVNLTWIRQHYFDDLIRQLQQISGDPALAVEIRDERGRSVARVGPALNGAAIRSRVFPLLFSDRAVLPPSAHRGAEPIATWTASVGIANDTSMLAARTGSARTLDLLGLGAIGAIAALVLTVRAARAAARLAMRQSEFVTAVTHDMKTPLSSIMLTGDSLAQGRYTSPEAVREYGQIIASEGHQLTRLIENVLCYARLIDTASSYAFEPLDVIELLSESVERFRVQIETVCLEVTAELPLTPLIVRGDRRMLRDAIDNVIDNAIKHGGSGMHLRVSGHDDGRNVHIQIADRGHGISPEELPKVFEKFYRGRTAGHYGSGLGLTIARRIIEEHGGTITIGSRVGNGTTVDIQLPLAIH